jgi:hypothetical protein
VLSGLAEAVRSSVQGIGNGLRADGAAVSAMLGMPPAGAAVTSSSSSGWQGEVSGAVGLAGGFGGNMGGIATVEGEMPIAAALAAAGFGRSVSSTSHASSSVASGAVGVLASRSNGSSASGAWPAALNVMRMSSGSGTSHSRDRSSGNTAGLMMGQHGMSAGGGVASAGASGPVQALLMQLPLVQGGSAYSPAHTAPGF